VSWVSQSPTVKEELLPPELAASAHWLCWTSHERPNAAAKLTKESELSDVTSKPRPAATTDGALIPPRAPVKVWRFAADAAELVAGAAELAAAEAAAEATTVEVTVVATQASVAAVAAAVEAAAVATLASVAAVAAAAVVAAAVADAADAATPVAETAATAALISSAVASSTNKFSEKMQPGSSSATSQVLPAAVGSPMVPGANVPDIRAIEGSPPMEEICSARLRTMFLFVAAAPVDAGS